MVFREAGADLGPIERIEERDGIVADRYLVADRISTDTFLVRVNDSPESGALKIQDQLGL